MHRVRVKICCIADVAEAWLAADAGADAIGLVAEMPSGPGPIPDEAIREIAAAAPPPLATFLLSSRTAPDEVLAHAQRCATSVIQLVDRVPDETYAALRAALPALKIVQVVHVEGVAAIAEARRVAPLVDALLLDSGKPSASVRTLGGTGETHDWRLSRRIVEAVDRPVWLAGGLTPRNVAEGIARVRPWGVDVCSGVRRGGRLDAEQLGAFVAAVSGAR